MSESKNALHNLGKRLDKASRLRSEFGGTAVLLDVAKFAETLDGNFGELLRRIERERTELIERSKQGLDYPEPECFLLDTALHLCHAAKNASDMAANELMHKHNPEEFRPQNFEHHITQFSELAAELLDKFDRWKPGDAEWGMNKSDV